MRSLGMAFVALCVVTCPVLAATRIVRPDGSGDFPTIQAAIDGVSDGDSVMATAGIYRGIGNRDINFQGRAIILFSQDGAPATIIDCEGTAADPHRAFVFASGETGSSIVEGFTIRHGHAGSQGTAGAISCIDSAPTIRSCMFSDNSAGSHAGAIDFLRGGGEILACQFERNRSGGSAQGGALRCNDASLTVSDCEFRDCSAGSGAALFAENSSIELSACRFLLCQAALGGGAIIALGGPGHSLGVADCAFDFCISSFGGGIAADGVSVRVLRSVFSNCFGTEGGASFLERGASEMSRCTFWNCSAQRGACILAHLATVNVENSIMAFSGQGIGIQCLSASSITLTCCDVFGNAGGDWVGCIAGQQGTNGNLAADPQFCAASNGDFSLHESSPCAPANSGPCGLIGALDVGCGATAVEGTTWGRLKAGFTR